MKPHTQASFATDPPHVTCFRRARASPSKANLPLPHHAGNHEVRRVWTAKRRRVSLSVRLPNRVVAAWKPEHSERSEREDSVESTTDSARARSSRRGVLVAPFLAAGASFLLSAARAEEKSPPPSPSSTPPSSPVAAELTAVKPDEQKKKEEPAEVVTSRIYDATAIGEPLAIGKEKGKVWEKLMNSRVVYLGEAEQVPVRDDKELELEIVKNLQRRCVEKEKRLSLALEAFPSDLQEPLNQYLDKK